MSVKAIEEEFWSYQYLTQLAGRGIDFWPEDGTGKFKTEEEAEIGLKNSGYAEGRILRVTRRIEYNPQFKVEGNSK